MVKLKTNKTLTKEPRKKNKDLIERKKNTWQVVIQWLNWKQTKNL
jgi:hypothetical protein